MLRMLADPKTSRTAFAALVNQYGQQLYRVIRRMVLNHEDANDVLQNIRLVVMIIYKLEVLLRLWLRLKMVV